MVGLHFSLLVIMYYLCTIKQYDTIVTIRDWQFVVERDVKNLKDAVEGWGTDEKVIIQIIGSRTYAQRQAIAKEFKASYGQDLERRMKKELWGHFKDTVVALIIPLPDFYAKELNYAMSRIGTKNDVLIEILGTLSNDDLRAVADRYKERYNEKLEDNIKKYTSGDFQTLCISLLTESRDESRFVNEMDVQLDARALVNAGGDLMGTVKSIFKRILVQKNFEHLKRVFEVYKEMSSMDIEVIIKRKFSKDMRMGLLSIVQIIKSKENYFANRLKNAVRGLGTNDRTLIRIAVTRSEVDMGGIKRAFQTLFNASLIDRIQSDTFGNYRKMLHDVIV